MRNLQVNGERLWASLMQLAQIGATAKGGVCRLAASDLDGEACGRSRAAQVSSTTVIVLGSSRITSIPRLSRFLATDFSRRERQSTGVSSINSTIPQ